MQMVQAHAIEHGSSRTGLWMRARRYRFTFALAAIEGLLYVLHVLHWWAAVGLALVALALWWFAGRRSRSHTFRELTWILAAAQLLVLLVPLALGILKVVAIAVIALLAVAALFVLFTERH
jgi:hypothetical protein